MKKIFSSLRVIAQSLFLFCALFLFSPTSVHAQTAWTNASGCTHGYGGKTDVATIQGLECLVGNVFAVVMTIIGFAAFVMFLIGSFRYLTAGTNTKGVESGKNAFTFAVIGIVVALLSFVILQFLSNFTGVTLFLRFNTQL